MLSDEQIDIFGEGFTDILQKLEDDIIADIARRVRKTNRFTETAELQARYLRDMGWSPYKIRIEVFRLLNADKAYIDFVEQNTLEAKALQKQAIAEAREALRKTAPELYAAAGDMSFNADLSMWREAGKKLKRGGAVDRLIKSMQKRGTDEVVNLTKTLGFKMPVGYTRLHRAYTSVLNDALTRTLSGGVSYTAAVEAAVRNLTRSGLRTVDYASGVSREIASAARNAVVTSLGQLTGDIMQTNIEESDVPMVQVSEHWGARESHALWQGKIFTVEQFKAVCGYGEPSNPDHIYSYNCRHTHYPYWPGISEPIAYQREPGPFTVNGRQYTYYEATQKQRAMERQIRALKREVNAGGDKAVLGSEIRQRTREYKAFSDACGIRPKLERLRVVGSGELMSPADLIRKAQMYANDTFDVFSPLDLSKQERTALEKLHKLCQADEYESAIKIVNGEVGEVVTSGAVGWVKTGDNPPGTTLLHSHTNDTPFSAPDLRHLTNKNVEKIGVVSYNGDAWMAYVGDGDTPTGEEFDSVVSSIRMEVDMDVCANYGAGEVSENDLQYIAIREQFFRICRHFKWTAEGGNLYE